jgi:hypothetical protein
VYTTSELSLRVVRPAQIGTILTAKGRLVYGGRTVALSEASIEDQKGRLIAHGSSLCFIFPPDRAVTEPPRELPTVRAPEYSTPDPYLRPVIGEIRPQELWDKMSGLEIMNAALAGELPAPPTRYLTGLRLVEVAREHASSRCLPVSGYARRPPRYRAASSRCSRTRRYRPRS